MLIRITKARSRRRLFCDHGSTELAYPVSFSMVSITSVHDELMRDGNHLPNGSDVSLLINRKLARDVVAQAAVSRD